MDYLSNKEKIALAKQFNLVVRAINEFQVENWKNLEEHGFKELIKTEKEILFFVECFLLSTESIFYEKPAALVIEVEKFCEDLKSELKCCNVHRATTLVSRASLLASSIYGLSPGQSKSIKQEFEYL